MICTRCISELPCRFCYYYIIGNCAGCEYNRTEIGIEKENPKSKDGRRETGTEAAASRLGNITNK
jgi:hypothetical protein